MKRYVKRLTLPDDFTDTKYVESRKMTCYGDIYPFKIFPDKGIDVLELYPLTVFCGSNGSGKSTLLNIIAGLCGLKRYSMGNTGAYFDDYLRLCRLESARIPDGSQMLTSDDVTDYLLDLRSISRGIDTKRNALLDEYDEKTASKYTFNRLTSIEAYDEWKSVSDAIRSTKSDYVNKRLTKNPIMYSNGETAMNYFIERMRDNTLILLDEPENSLSPTFQKELADYISASVTAGGCQFIISTHSPFFLSMANAHIYDLDSEPVELKDWTQLGHIREYYELFKKYSAEFDSGN